MAIIELWLDLLRRQYNYRLSERFLWWQENRCPINACPLIMPIPLVVKKSRKIITENSFLSALWSSY
ncbi:hypothetical protein [Okeania sp. KiyG1]|uniref:hypothetical protein n=1 Tax=Okeania sp. KiyG1 TaxID=2720165 RepID=UPI001F213564|nr:hypothetical protein [Okeania sp. KiyG1]